MTKEQFLRQLRQRLAGLPEEDLRKQLQYYSEMIDDRMEDGMTEDEAVAGIELPEPLPKKERKALPVWAIILLILGSPIWLSLLVAVASVVLSLYVTLWAVVITLYTVPITLGACAVGGIGMIIVTAITGPGILCILWLGAALLCAGLCMFAGFSCNLLAKGAAGLTKWSFKALFTGKEKSL